MARKSLMFVIVVLALLIAAPGALADHDEQTVAPGSTLTVEKNLDVNEVLSVAWDATGKVNFYVKDPDGITLRLQNEATFGFSVIEADKSGTYTVGWENTEAVAVTVGYDMDFLQEGLSAIVLGAIIGGIVIGAIIIIVIVLLLVSSDKKKRQPYYAPAQAPTYAPMAYMPPAVVPAACPKCGGAVGAQAAFCPKCGAKVK